MTGEINNLGVNNNSSSDELVSLMELQRYIVTSFAKDCYLLIIRDLLRQNNGPFQYSDDEETTKIHVADRFEIPKEVQTLKPAIYLTRGRMGYSNLTIDNLKSMNMNTGRKTYSDLIRGSMIINCASQEGLEAEHLASIMFIALQSFKERFQKMGFHKFDVGEILEERPLKTDTNITLVEVPVTTTFSFGYHWALNIMNSTPLNNIIMSRARDVDPNNPYCSSTVNECGINIGIDGTGKDCGPFESLPHKWELKGDIPNDEE